VTSERFCYLHVTDQYTLHQFGGNLRNAFPTAIGILHVGSSVTRPNWRDVDVRGQVLIGEAGIGLQLRDDAEIAGVQGRGHHRLR
jgi:hypothetical protein